MSGFTTDDFSLVPKNGYKIILADPPWKFQTRSEKGLDGRPQHYPRMSVKQIKEMPVAEKAHKDCWLFLWVTSPHLEIGIEVLNAWGFKYSSVAFNWIKLNPKAPSMFFTLDDFHKGQGYTTRKNSELCLLGRIGKPRRKDANVEEIIIDPRREHSRKPEESYDRIKRFASGPRLEMFARQCRDGWDAFGNEVKKFGG